MALTPGLQDTFKVHAEESAKLHAFRQNLLEAGLKSGSVDDSVIKTGAAVTKDVQGSLAEQAEKQAKQRADDIMFLALLDSLDAQIAENERVMGALEETMAQLSSGEINVEEAMSRSEVLDAIRDWEQRTGRKFDPENDNAAEELMVIMQDQHDQIAIDTVLRKNEFNTIAEKVPGFDKRFDVEPVDVTAEVAVIVEQGASSAKAIAQTSEVDEFVSTATDSRDDHRETILSDAGNSGLNSDKLDMFAMDKVVGLGGTAMRDFGAVSPPADTEIEPEVTPIPSIDNNFG